MLFFSDIFSYVIYQAKRGVFKLFLSAFSCTANNYCCVDIAVHTASFVKL